MKYRYLVALLTTLLGSSSIVVYNIYIDNSTVVHCGDCPKPERGESDLPEIPPPPPMSTMGKPIPPADVPPCRLCWDYQDVPTNIEEKPALFRIAILTHHYKWNYGSSRETERGMLSRILPSYLDSLDKFHIAKQFVAVGVASEEGNIQRETLRAANRADEISGVLQPQIGGRDLYLLNLGQYTHPTGLEPSETAYQRRVIVVAVLERDPEMDERVFSLSLRDALSNSSGIAFNRTNYSEFDLQPLQLRQ